MSGCEDTMLSVDPSTLPASTPLLLSLPPDDVSELTFSSLGFRFHADGEITSELPPRGSAALIMPWTMSIDVNHHVIVGQFGKMLWLK